MAVLWLEVLRVSSDLVSYASGTGGGEKIGKSLDLARWVGGGQSVSVKFGGICVSEHNGIRKFTIGTLCHTDTGQVRAAVSWFVFRDQSTTWGYIWTQVRS